MLTELLPTLSAVVFTSNHNPRALSPATLQSLAEQLGAAAVRNGSDPARALALAREAAGPDGIALATGSIYLVADLRGGAAGRRRSRL